MKFGSFPLVVLGLQFQRALAAFRPDIKGPVEVAELEPGQIVTEGATEVPMRLSPGSDFVVLFKCSEGHRKVAISADNQFVGCCLPGQHLSGSEQTSFDCCGSNHELAGDVQVGFTCCPTGYVYDGSQCREGSESTGAEGQQPVQQHLQMESKGGGDSVRSDNGNGGSSAEGQPHNHGNHDNHQQLVRQPQDDDDYIGNPHPSVRNRVQQQPQGQGQYQGGNQQVGGGQQSGGSQYQGGNQQLGGSQQSGGSQYQGGNQQLGGGQYQGGNQQLGGGQYQGGNSTGGSTTACGTGTALLNGECVCTSSECGRLGPIIACVNGTRPVNGKCICPKGHTWGADGWCRPCTSGIETGKCYTFAIPNGVDTHMIGYDAIHNYYGPAPEDRNHRAGKFKLCEDRACTPGIPIDPTDGFRILDTHGNPNTGANPNQWLNNASNGGHITKTPDYAQAGVFTLTKWPCGKYCLGGLYAGVGPTCPADVVGMTFTTPDKDSCVVVDLTEVPCDVHAKANNCIWKNGDQCCDKVDCRGKY